MSNLAKQQPMRPGLCGHLAFGDGLAEDDGEDALDECGQPEELQRETTKAWEEGAQSDAR